MAVRQDDDRHSWRVLQAALMLILCRDERRLPPKLLQRMLHWMQRSPENLIHLFEIARVDQALDRLKLRDRSAQLSAPMPPPRHTALATRRAVMIGGAAVVALIVGLSLPTMRNHGAIIQHMTLEDGSVMHVLRGAEFDIEYSGEARLIKLPFGEAVFEVVKDPSRPFIVRSKLSDSIAVGTRFGVVANPSETITTVSEGVVRVVVPAGNDPATGTIVRAGEEFRVSAGASRTEPVRPVNAERKMSWSAGWLEFDGETIGEAVSTFNRFNDVQIKIIQPELASARLKYYRFEIANPQSFAVYLGNALGAPVVRTSTGSVIYVGDGQRKRE